MNGVVGAADGWASTVRLFIWPVARLFRSLGLPGLEVQPGMTYRAAAKPAPAMRARAARPRDRTTSMPRKTSDSEGDPQGEQPDPAEGGAQERTGESSGERPQERSQGHLLWGGRFSAKPGALMQAINVSIGFDKRLAIEDLAGSKAHVAMLAAQGIISAEDEAAIQRGLADIEQEIEAGDLPVPRGVRGHPLQCREAAGRADRAGGRPAAYGPVAQRPGGARLPALGARRLRPHGRADHRAAAGAARPGRDPRGDADAGLHPPAERPAGDLRPSPDGLCRDVRPRRRPRSPTPGPG